MKFTDILTKSGVTLKNAGYEILAKAQEDFSGDGNSCRGYSCNPFVAGALVGIGKLCGANKEKIQARHKKLTTKIGRNYVR